MTQNPVLAGPAKPALLKRRPLRWPLTVEFGSIAGGDYKILTVTGIAQDRAETVFFVQTPDGHLTIPVPVEEVLETCRTAQVKGENPHFHITPPPPRNIGDLSEDRKAVFCGLSPTTGKPFFTTRGGDSGPATWVNAADLVGRWGVSFSRNGISRRKTEQDLLIRGDDGGWRLPTMAEARIMYDNRDAGYLKGTFNTGAGTGDTLLSSWYWTSTEYEPYSDERCYLRFSDGTEGRDRKDFVKLPYRPVFSPAAS